MILDHYYQLPPDFLAGEDARFAWVNVPVRGTLSTEDWTTFANFMWRASEFLKNVEDLALPNTHTGNLQSHYEGGRKGQFSTNIWPGRYRAKSVILDFRPLLLQKGKDGLANFYRNRNLVAKSTDDQALLEFMDQIKRGFLANQIRLSIDRSIPLEIAEKSSAELIDLWFNTYYFHGGDLTQVQRVRDIMTLFEGEGIEQAIFFEVVQSAHSIRSLYGVLRQVVPRHPFFLRPSDVVLRR
jgi:hypothetical protein